MRILALDAATEACSVALLSDVELISRTIEAGKSNAAQILSMAQEVLAEAQVSLSMLDAIAASIGPGSFTGVRVSVAVAQGLAYGADLKVIPITTLEALALQVIDDQDQDRRALACLDARMGEVYWGCFAWDAASGVLPTSAPRVGPPGNVALDSGAQYRGVGRGFSAYPILATLPGVTIDGARSAALPNAREIARLGALRLNAGGLNVGGLDAADLKPLYLRDKVAFTEAERMAQSAL
jgi:tRNA threonylcarbamoyladenosine biosynthesis protein TsaB